MFFAIITLYYFKAWKAYFATWKRPRITFISILIFGVTISLVKGKAMYDIFVGIKYGLLYLFIFLSATFIGYIWNKKDSKILNSKFYIMNYVKFLKYLLITTLIV
ncbi:MAG: hypothetical protein WCL02_06900 [bacterium]